MAKSTYTVAAPEGADFVAGHSGEKNEVGDKVDLDLRADQERALVAAGWLEPEKKKEK